MRRMKSVLLVLLTAVLVAAGAVMPYAVSRAQDQYLENQQEVWVFDPVGLRLGNEPKVWPALCLMAGSYDLMGWVGETNLSEEDARNAARVAAAVLEDNGLAVAGISLVSLEHMWGEADLMVSSDVRGLSAVIWIFSWDWVSDESEGFANIYIDDNTGKMVSAIVAAEYMDEPEETYKQMEAWRVFLADYYGLEEVPFLGERKIFEYDEEPELLLERRFLLEFDLGEELGKYKIALDLRYGLAAFNI